MNNIKELQEKGRYFQERPPKFPGGKPYNCCECVLLVLAEYLGIKSDIIPKIAAEIVQAFH